MKKQGILLCNLGTPDAPTPEAVKRYLAEFLHDKRVVSISRWIWCIILHGIVLRVRPKKVAKLYQSIWTEEGSPLLAITKQQHKALQQRFPDTPIEIGMAYGNPSLASGLEKLQEQGCERIIVCPLYPQYSSATTASIFDRVAKYFRDKFNVPEIVYMGNYYNHPLYVSALKQSILDYQAVNGKADKLLLSYHGVPERFTRNGDPYEAQCRETTRLLVESMGLTEDDYAISFQSRFGKEEWVKPYTSDVLTQWAKDDVRSVQIISPAFSVDCLETLEELAVESKLIFLENHASSSDSKDIEYQYIPALNASSDHIDLLESLIKPCFLPTEK